MGKTGEVEFGKTDEGGIEVKISASVAKDIFSPPNESDIYPRDGKFELLALLVSL